MIFNRNNNGNEELRELTGNYYLSNDFKKIKVDIELATEDLIKIIGWEVYSRAEKHYQEFKSDKTNDTLVPHIQLPIAIMATLQMYRKNDVSHEDSGRKIKINPEVEKLPWEWQLKRDDEIHLDNYYKAVDRLISFLNRSEIVEWENSSFRKTTELLFIRNTELFDQYFPIEKSGRMFVLLTPFIKEAERIYLKPALGSDYTKLLSGKDLTEKESELLQYVYPPIPLIAMSLAIRRLPLSVIPAGIIRNYVSSSETMNASQPATIREVKALSSWLMDDAMTLLDDMKQFRNGATEVKLLPDNNPRNKYLRT